MYAQVIDGRTTDRDALKARVDAWVADVQPGAEGFEGMTVTCADDGRFVAVMRFVSKDAAQKNGDRAEQDAWWKATEAVIEGEARYRESDDIELIFGGGSDQAGFVQVIESEPRDRKHLISVEASLLEGLKKERPEVMGSIRCWYGPNAATEVIYFTSEAEAREGEKKEPPPELVDTFGEYMQLSNPIEFVDSNDPWLISP